jgi:hypothetical protein
VQAPRNRRLANPYRLWILRGERLLWAGNENRSKCDRDGERNQFVFQQSNTSYFGFLLFQATFMRQRVGVESRDQALAVIAA